MATPVTDATGTQTAVSTTPYTLRTTTVPGSFKLLVDANALSGADALALEVDAPARSGGTARIYDSFSYRGQQGAPILETPVVDLPHAGAVFKLTYIGGGGNKDFPWTVVQVIDSDTAAIKAKTDNLPSDPADASDIAAAFTSLNTKVDTIDDFLDTEIADIRSRLPATLDANGFMKADVEDWKGAVAPAMTGDAYARIGANGAGLTALGDARLANLDVALSVLAGYIDTEIAAIKAKTDNLPSDPADASDVAAAVSAVVTTAMAESYAADGATMTLAQALYEIRSLLSEFAIVGTLMTTRKKDGVTPAATYTLDSATSPTSITRTT